MLVDGKVGSISTIPYGWHLLALWLLFNLSSGSLMGLEGCWLSVVLLLVCPGTFDMYFEIYRQSYILVASRITMKLTNI